MRPKTTATPRDYLFEMEGQLKSRTRGNSAALSNRERAEGQRAFDRNNRQRAVTAALTGGGFTAIATGGRQAMTGEKFLPRLRRGGRAGVIAGAAALVGAGAAVAAERAASRRYQMRGDTMYNTRTGEAVATYNPRAREWRYSDGTVLTADGTVKKKNQKQ